MSPLPVLDWRDDLRTVQLRDGHRYSIRLGDVTEDERDAFWTAQTKTRVLPEPLAMYVLDDDGTQVCNDCLADALDCRDIKTFEVTRVSQSAPAYEQCDLCLQQYDSDDATATESRYAVMLMADGYVPRSDALRRLPR